VQMREGEHIYNEIMMLQEELEDENITFLLFIIQLK
jgi:hypothetical protein